MPIHTPYKLGWCNEINEGEIDAPFLKEIGASSDAAVIEGFWGLKGEFDFGHLGNKLVN